MEYSPPWSRKYSAKKNRPKIKGAGHASNRAVYVFDAGKTLLHTFESITIASEELKINYVTLRGHIRNGKILNDFYYSYDPIF
jgi:hypothetical protein